MITIALIGCGKKKAQMLSRYCEARNLYESDLFKKRVFHVESRNLPWYILSAKSGLLNPNTQIRTYDQVLSDLTEIERAEWHVGVANQLLTELYFHFNEPKLSGVTVEFHAGEKYCEPLGSILTLLGMNVSRPVKGLGIGKQLAFYS